MLTLHSRSESFPLVILEGMYFGKPAVCSRVGGVGEQIQEGFNGYLFEEGDTKGQAECFQKIYSNRESWIAKTNDIRGYYLNHFNSKKLNQKLSDIVMNQIQTRQKHES